MASQIQTLSYKREEDKIRGIMAKVRIPFGTRILEEIPLFSFWPEDLNEHNLRTAFSTLSAAKQAQIENLRCRDQEGQNRLMTIFESNCIKADDGIFHFFLNVSHLQHSCCPNAIVDWNSNIQCLTVHTLRNIPAEKEITISYINNSLPTASRKLLLWDQFGVDCQCPRCLAVHVASVKRRGTYIEYETTIYTQAFRKKEDRLWEIEGLLTKYDDHPATWRAKYPDNMPLDLAQELIRLHKDEVAIVPLSPTFRRAAMYAEEEGNVERAICWAQEEIKNAALCYGLDSQRTLDARAWYSALRYRYNSSCRR